MDITQLILVDHHEQRRLFAILEQIPRDDTRSLTAVWSRLSAFLGTHAEAEEQIFYPALLRLGEGGGEDTAPEAETRDAIHDHNDIRDAVANVASHDVGGDDWYEAVARLAKANGDHMAEEEREGLTAFRRRESLQERHHLGVAFAAFEAAHVSGVAPQDKDPVEYVEQHLHDGL